MNPSRSSTLLQLSQVSGVNELNLLALDFFPDAKKSRSTQSEARIGKATRVGKGSFYNVSDSLGP